MGRDRDIQLRIGITGHFNSHARVGRDTRISVKTAFPNGFQLTRPRGARRRFEKGHIPANNFNSHARVGRDLESLIGTMRFQMISTHTPAWGAT